MVSPGLMRAVTLVLTAALLPGRTKDGLLSTLSSGKSDHSTGGFSGGHD